MGSGKSLLMDMFAEASAELHKTPSASELGDSIARRAHFHEFMLEIHARLHKLQAARPRKMKKTIQGQLTWVLER